MDERRKVQPSKRCPKCNAFVDAQELIANNGVCNHCTPVLAVTLPKSAEVVKRNA